MNEAQDDIELFKKQLGNLDKAVNNTANRIDAIQEALDKVLENLRLGKPIEPFQSIGSTTNEETHLTENSNANDVPNSAENVNEDVEKVTNSYEIFDRDRLVQVLKEQKLDKLKNPPRLTVGMIGYPNVGKSSSVNVLMQTKKVK